MASSAFLMRLVSSSVAVANRAGGIIRRIMKTGSLGVVDKVCCIFVYLKIDVDKLQEFQLNSCISGIVKAFKGLIPR